MRWQDVGLSLGSLEAACLQSPKWMALWVALALNMVYFYSTFKQMFYVYFVSLIWSILLYGFM